LTPGTGLYDPMYEHDACGLGFVARVDGRQTRETVEEALEVLHNLEHRGASGSDPDTGDGAGVLLQMPDRFLRAAVPFDLPPAGAYATGIAFKWAGYRMPDEIGEEADMRRLLDWGVDGLITDAGTG